MTLNNVTIGNGDIYVQIEWDNIAKAVRKQNTDYKKERGNLFFHRILLYYADYGMI